MGTSPASSASSDTADPRPLFFAAALALGWAVHSSNGKLSREGLVLVGGAGVLLAAGIWRWSRASLPTPLEKWRRWAPYSVAVAAATQLPALVINIPPLSGAFTATPGWLFLLLVPLALGLVACAWPLRSDSRCRSLQALPLLVAYLVVGAMTLWHSPNPHIDVYVFQRDASTALLNGSNPYAMTFPDIYHPGRGFYSPSVTQGGRVLFGFPYPPLSLLFVTPAVAVLADPRFAHLVALVLAAALIARLRPGRFGALTAALLLLTPRSLYVLNQAWTEPLAILLLALVVTAVERVPRLVSHALALLVAAKQYMVMLVPPLWLLLPAERSMWPRFLVRAVVVGAVATLPLALWSLPDFWRSAVSWQLLQPTRRDALSFMSALGRVGVALPLWVPFVLSLFAGVFAAGQLPRGGTTFAAAVALTLWAFFAFNKQAFCNYYFLVIGAALIAALGPRHRS